MNIKQAKDSLKKALTARRAAERAEMKAIKDLIAAGDEYRGMDKETSRDKITRLQAEYDQVVKLRDERPESWQLALKAQRIKRKINEIKMQALLCNSL